MKFSMPKRLSLSIKWSSGLLAALLLAVVFFLPPKPAFAWTINEIKTEFTVQTDASVIVEQLVTATALPGDAELHLLMAKEYVPGQGRQQILNLEVRDNSGNEISLDNIKILDDFDRYTVALPGEPGSVTPITWRLSYQITRAVNSVVGSSSFNEFSWLMVLPENLYIIEKIDAVLVLPADISENSASQSILLGSLNELSSPDTYSILTNGNYYFQASDLDPYEQFRIISRWEGGSIVNPPAALPARIWKVIKVPYLVSPLIGLVFLIIWFLHYGRDPKGDKSTSVTIKRSPPDGLSATQADALIEERVRIRALAAMVIDLAQRGFIRVIEKERRSEHSRKEYALVRSNLNNSAGLSRTEAFFIEKLFLTSVRGGKSANRADLSEIKQRFAQDINVVRNLIFTDLVKLRYFRESPMATRSKYVVASVVVATIGIPVWLVGGLAYHSALSGLPIFIIALMILLFAPIMPQKTKQGVIVLKAIKGYEKYVKKNILRDADKANSTIFQNLPYFVVFGIDAEWAELVVEKTRPPHWYISSTEFSAQNLIEFSHSLRSTLRHAASQTVGSDHVKAHRVHKGEAFNLHA